MVQGADLFLALFNNLALFIALVCIYGFVHIQYRLASPLRQQALMGLVFGLFALGCMAAKIPVYEGVLVDQRNAIVALGGAFGGPVTALIAGVLAGSYRIYLGGGGVTAGLIGLCLAGGAGLVIRRIPGAFTSAGRAGASALVATTIILPGFLFVGDVQTGWTLLKAMALPYGGGCYISIFLAGILLNREEEKHARELAFRETKERLDLALSGANEGLWDWDLEHNTLHFDDRYYTLSGYTPGEFPMAFEEWEKRIHPSDRAGVTARVQGYLSGKQAEYSAEFRFLHKSGDYMWILGKGKTVARDASGAPKRFIGTHSDITARKEIERSLKIARFSFDTAAIGIYLVGADAGILEANRHAEQMLGYARGELAGKTIFDIDALATREDWEASWAALCEKGHDQFERVHKDRAGRQIPVEVTSSLLAFEDRTCAVAFTKDISRRRADEKQIRNLKNHLASIIESMPSLLICLDSGCRVTLWNRQAGRVMSGPGERGRPADQMFPFLADQMAAVRESLDTGVGRQVLKIPFDWGAEKPGVADLTIFPLKAEGMEGAVVRVDDVTEKVRLEEILIQNEKMLSIGGLAAGMAHEINNPLAGVIQNASVLSNRLLDPTIPANVQAAGELGLSLEAMGQYMARRKVPELLRSIGSAGARMADIVENMLGFARKNESSFSTHSPAALMDTVLDLAATDYDLKKHYDFKSIAIEKVYEKDLPLVPCEKGGIQQVLLNLLVNGAHAMFAHHGPEGPKFTLRLSHERDREMLRMEIEDNGPGMDKETTAKIFEPFFTTKPVGEGTGLGLSISYFIITDNHRGSMTVVSEPGKGTCFTIRLPVTRR